MRGWETETLVTLMLIFETTIHPLKQHDRFLSYVPGDRLDVTLKKIDKQYPTYIKVEKDVVLCISSPVTKQRRKRKTKNIGSIR
jgi:hypothetical protein